VQPLERRLCALEEQRHPEASGARELFRQMATAIAGIGERRVSSITDLRLRQLQSDGKYMAVTVVHDIVMAEPLIAAGSIAAQLRIHGP
jgi:hypothetical protein